MATRICKKCGGMQHQYSDGPAGTGRKYWAGCSCDRYKDYGYSEQPRRDGGKHHTYNNPKKNTRMSYNTNPDGTYKDEGHNVDQSTGDIYDWTEKRWKKGKKSG